MQSVCYSVFSDTTTGRHQSRNISNSIHCCFSISLRFHSLFLIPSTNLHAWQRFSGQFAIKRSTVQMSSSPESISSAVCKAFDRKVCFIICFSCSEKTLQQLLPLNQTFEHLNRANLGTKKLCGRLRISVQGPHTHTPGDGNWRGPQLMFDCWSAGGILFMLHGS